MLDNEYVLAGVAAQIIDVDYVGAIKVFRKDNALVFDKKGRGCVPASYLNRFPGYRAYVRAIPEEARHRGPLFVPAPPKSPLVVGLRDIQNALPLQWMFPSYMRDSNIGGWNNAEERVDEGRIPDRSTLMQLLAAGKVRTLTHNKTLTRFYLSDFLKPMSWASPAEKTWRQGAEILGDLLERRRGKTPKEGLEHMALPELVDEEVEWGIPMKRGRPAAGVPRDGVPLPPGAEVLESPSHRYSSKGQSFTWETEALQLPPPAQLDYYLAAIPEPVIEMAWHTARNWAEVLFEERTGYNQVVGNIKESEWPGLREAREKVVYENRKAWKGGCLQPLMPAGFSFIF